MSNQETNREKLFPVPLVWDNNEEIETIYINHLKVTHSGPEFYIYFGELPYPVIIKENEIPKELTIKTKVRLAVSPDQMGNIVKAINENYENFMKKKEKSE
ncbi:MAG: DUF3467 domain-containing protein [Candidatus Helarchaeota archaeon]